MSEVAREDAPGGRRYVIHGPEGEAEMIVSAPSPGCLVAEHTYVPDALRGRGLAQALLDALLADARAEGAVIEPACAFVAAEARRHPEWAALFAG